MTSTKKGYIDQYTGTIFFVGLLKSPCRKCILLLSQTIQRVIWHTHVDCILALYCSVVHALMVNAWI
jgi:hypothetical protein